MKHELAPGVIQHFADLTNDELERQASQVMAILRLEARKAEERLRGIVRRLRTCLGDYHIRAECQDVRR